MNFPRPSKLTQSGYFTTSSFSTTFFWLNNFSFSTYKFMWYIYFDDFYFSVDIDFHIFTKFQLNQNSDSSIELGAQIFFDLVWCWKFSKKCPSFTENESLCSSSFGAFWTSPNFDLNVAPYLCWRIFIITP